MAYDVIQSSRATGKVVGVSGPYKTKRLAEAARKRFEKHDANRVHKSTFIVVKHGKR